MCYSVTFLSNLGCSAEPIKDLSQLPPHQKNQRVWGQEIYGVGTDTGRLFQTYDTVIILSKPDKGKLLIMGIKNNHDVSYFFCESSILFDITNNGILIF